MASSRGGGISHSRENLPRCREHTGIVGKFYSGSNVLLGHLDSSGILNGFPFIQTRFAFEPLSTARRTLMSKEINCLYYVYTIYRYIVCIYLY